MLKVTKKTKFNLNYYKIIETYNSVVEKKLPIYNRNLIYNKKVMTGQLSSKITFYYFLILET